MVVGADYSGIGSSDEPEGYVVKASHRQATYDLLIASRAVVDHMGVSTPKLFLGGWSQGGFVTMGFLEKLEDFGRPRRGGGDGLGAGRRLCAGQRRARFPAQD